MGIHITNYHESNQVRVESIRLKSEDCMFFHISAQIRDQAKTKEQPIKDRYAYPRAITATSKDLDRSGVVGISGHSSPEPYDMLMLLVGTAVVTGDWRRGTRADVGC